MDRRGRTPDGAGGRRLVLGFDAGCATCGGIAKRVEEKAEGKLEIRSLHHPQVEHWRGQALGPDVPWAPTLIEVDAGKVKAWTGLRMGIALSRRLGLAKTWRLMQVLGESGRPPRQEGPTARSAASAAASS